jgi:hypothetical protein
MRGTRVFNPRAFSFVQTHATLAAGPITSGEVSVAPLIDDEWRRWIAENLLLDAAPESVHAVLVQHGFEAAHAQREINSALESPYFRGSARLRNRLRKREWILSVYGELNRMRARAV